MNSLKPFHWKRVCMWKYDMFLNSNDSKYRQQPGGIFLKKENLQIHRRNDKNEKISHDYKRQKQKASLAALVRYRRQ